MPKKTDAEKQRKKVSNFVGNISGNYHNIAQVRQNYEQYRSLSASANENQLLETFRLELEKLKSELIAQEQSLYSLLGGGTTETISILKDKIDEWNNETGLKNMLNNSKLINDILGVFPQIDETQLLDELNKFLNTNEAHDAIINSIEMNSDKEDSPVAQAINTVIEQLDINTSTFKRMPSKGTKKGLDASLKIQIIDNKILITQDENLKLLSPGIKQHIANLLNEANGGQVITTSKKNMDSIHEEILHIIDNDCQFQSIWIRQAIGKEVHDRPLNAYALYANFDVVKGWLGEIYWNSFFSYLKGFGVSLPTGNIKNRLGQSLSVDAIIKSANAGFQIKHWNMDASNNVTRSYSMGFGTFLNNRAELFQYEPKIGETIAHFFGSLSYNKDISDQFDKGAYSADYTSLYNEMESNINEDFLTRLFNYRINRIIKIDGKSGKFLDDAGHLQEYYNTFWLVNDKVIPSSAIVQSMLDALREYQTRMVYLDSLNLQDRISNEKQQWPYKGRVNFEDDVSMANRWIVSYTLHYDFSQAFSPSELISRAAALVKK